MSLICVVLSPADQNANQLGLRKYTLTFVDKRMEKQYKLITARKAKRSSQIIYGLAILVYGGYSLGQSLLLKDDVYTFSRLGVFIGFVLFGFLLTTDFYRTQYFNVTLFVSVSLLLLLKLWVVYFSVLCHEKRIRLDWR